MSSTINLNKLNTLLTQIVPLITEQYLNEFIPMLRSINHAEGPNPLSGCCLYLNHLLCEQLKHSGYPNAKLVGGAASFGFNKSETGLVEYGRMNTLTNGYNSDGSRFDGSAFAGHCWVVIESLIIDASLMYLPSQIATDNALHGITKQEAYLLNPEKLVIPFSELKTREQLFNFEIGYSYVESESISCEALKRITLIKKNITRLNLKSKNTH